MNHPKQVNKSGAKANTATFFGPKLHQQIKQIENEIANVKLIETNTYNYGVPQSDVTVKRTKSADNKIHSKSHSNLNLQQQQQSQLNLAPKMTSEIYVFARKRPKLDCESNFTDVISIQNSDDAQYVSDLEHEEFHDHERDHESQPTPRLSSIKSICVNEVKSTVDGTPILRKNEFVFDNTFDASHSNEDIFKSSILPFIDSQSVENR